MKKRITALFLLFFILSSSLFSREMKEVRTEHFRIIYSPSSEIMAEEIFEVCEAYYSRLVAFWGEDPDLFLPIYIEESIREYNAYFTAYPSNRIVMYNSPVSFSLSNSSNSVRMTFLHELTHAFTFSFKGTMGKVSTFLLGDYANFPLYLHLLAFLQEGISVFTESMGGEGRLNDPFFRGSLLQGRIENKSIDYMDVSGGRDLFPGGGMWYSYGGAFIEWVSKKYSEEAVGEYYKRMAKRVFSFPQNAYSAVFGETLENDWQSFCSSVSVPEKLMEPHILFSESRIYSNLTLHEGRLYLLSQSSSDVLEVGDEGIRSLFSFSPSSSGLSISEEGRFLIPYRGSTLSYVGIYERNGKRVEKYDTYHDGAFLPDGRIVLLKEEDRVAWLDVYDEESITKTISLGYNTESFCFVTIPNGVAFLLFQEGKESIAVLDSYSLALSLFTLPENLVISSLSSFGAVLSFSYAWKASNYELPRYGELKLESGELSLSPVFFNGGVNYPVRKGEEVWFSSSFFERGGISKEEAQALSLTPFALLSSSPFVPLSPPEIKINEGAKAYNPFFSLTRGAIIPLSSISGTFFTDSSGLGLSWYSSDPSGNYSLYLTAGYSFSDSCFTQIKAQYRGLGLSISLQRDDSGYRGEENLFISHTFLLRHSGEKITTQDTLSHSFYNGRNRIDNYLFLSYSNLRKKGGGRYRIKGVECTFEMVNLQAYLSLFFRFPSLFPFSSLSRIDWGLPLTLGLTVGIKEAQLEGRIKVNFLTLEVQNAVRFLSLYFSHIDLYGSAGLVYGIREKSLYRHYSLTLSSFLSPVIGELSRVQWEVGIRLDYRESSGFRPSLIVRMYE